MVQPPHTYAEWVKLLKEFAKKTNDSEVIPAMKAGTLEWQSGVAERFIRHFSSALDQRMKVALDEFDTDMKRTTDFEEGYVRSLNALNRSFVLIRDTANLPCVPEEYRVQLVEMVEEVADSAQQSLEDSAQVLDRSGQTTSIVRNHAVNRF